MDTTLSTAAEMKALAATELPTFSGFDLLQCKRTVAEILSLIGREGPFREYTVHDIRHIDAMLGMAEWIVPSQTQAVMTPADWILLVLAVYFHDLGMAVTKDEFDRRTESDFVDFSRATLAEDADDLGEYVAKVKRLPPLERDVFLYQEFVRSTHARRIRAWIEGNASRTMGASEAVASEVGRVLNALDYVFRGDLATVCESHHLDDLDNFTKYPLSQPYGKLHRGNSKRPLCRHPPPHT
jgi:hypothetical protein